MIEVTAKDLRNRAAEILRAVGQGERVTVTYHGRPVAEIRPVRGARRAIDSEEDVFGIWSDREDLKDAREWVRDLRRVRGDRSS